jgi:sugar-specific transcriptional regulator TrmB
MDIESSLKRIGLTAGETRVYMALLGSDETTSGRIVKKAGVSSSKVYPILDRLIAMGLVTYIRKGRVRHFRTTSPAKILDMLEKGKADIEEKKAEVQRMLPALMARERERKPGHEASVYEGYKAVKSYYREMLSGAGKGEERLVLGARSGYPVARGAQYFFRSFHRSWVKKGLKTRMVFNEDLRGKESVAFFKGFPLTEVRFLPHVTLSSIGIQGQGIDILVWTRDTALLFVVKSREVAKTFREYFEVLWSSARR